MYNTITIEKRSESYIAYYVTDINDNDFKSCLFYDFRFNMMSSAQDLFRHTGYIEAKLPEDELKVAEADPENFNIDKYVDLAIEVGAEDVTLEPGESGPILRVGIILELSYSIGFR